MMIKKEIAIDHIKPEWFRREVAEAIANGERISLLIYHPWGSVSEFPIALTDKRKE